jgi:hypothetical protein
MRSAAERYQFFKEELPMKKLLSVILALLLALGMMSFAAAEEPFEITVMVPEFTYDADYVEEGNPILAKIEELEPTRFPEEPPSSLPSGGEDGEELPEEADVPEDSSDSEALPENQEEGHPARPGSIDPLTGQFNLFEE